MDVLNLFFFFGLDFETVVPGIYTVSGLQIWILDFLFLGADLPHSFVTASTDCLFGLGYIANISFKCVYTLKPEFSLLLFPTL